jgi:hypothetical protein
MDVIIRASVAVKILFLRLIQRHVPYTHLLTLKAQVLTWFILSWDTNVNYCAYDNIGTLHTDIQRCLYRMQCSASCLPSIQLLS